MSEPRRPRAPRTRAPKHVPPSYQARPVRTDSTDPEHLAMIRRIASAMVNDTGLFGIAELGPLERCVYDTMRTPTSVASLIVELLWMLGICAKDERESVLYTTDPGFGPLRFLSIREASRAGRRTLDVCAPGARGVDVFVPGLVLFLANLIGADPIPREQIFAELARPDEPTGAEHEYRSDGLGGTKLMLVPNRWGFVAHVDDDVSHALEIAAIREDGEEATPEQVAVETLRASARIGAGGVMRIAPTDYGWTVSEVDALPSVTIATHMASDEVNAALRDLYATMNGDAPEERDYGPDSEISVLVHGRHNHDRLKTYPEDLAQTIRDVAKLIDRMPGDPGAACSLERRVEGVLKELQKGRTEP